MSISPDISFGSKEFLIDASDLFCFLLAAIILCTGVQISINAEIFSSAGCLIGIAFNIPCVISGCPVPICREDNDAFRNKQQINNGEELVRLFACIALSLVQHLSRHKNVFPQYAPTLPMITQLSAFDLSVYANMPLPPYTGIFPLVFGRFLPFANIIKSWRVASVFNEKTSGNRSLNIVCACCSKFSFI